MNGTRTILSRYGLHCTTQRAALYDALAATASHPTAEELYRTVRAHLGSLSLATVYAALETFCRVGLARRVPTLAGSSRYDATTSEHVHVQYVGTGCIEDVPPDLGARLLASVPAEVLREIEGRLGVRIEGVDVQLRVASSSRTRTPKAGVAFDR